MVRCRPISGDACDKYRHSVHLHSTDTIQLPHFSTHIENSQVPTTTRAQCVFPRSLGRNKCSSTKVACLMNLHRLVVNKAHSLALRGRLLLNFTWSKLAVDFQRIRGCSRVWKRSEVVVCCWSGLKEARKDLGVKIMDYGFDSARGYGFGHRASVVELIVPMC